MSKTFLAMQKIVNESKKLERETIFIFQSDNGGAVNEFGSKDGKFGKSMTPRACNFPYKAEWSLDDVNKFNFPLNQILNVTMISFKGFKNTLYEGGTLSPSFIYSTKRQFANKKVEDIVHIMDWFSTILDLSGYNMRKLPSNLDGVSQKIVLEKTKYEAPRTKFIYGLLHRKDNLCFSSFSTVESV